MITKPNSVDMQNQTLNVPGQVVVTRLNDSQIHLAHQFRLGDRTVTGACCILAPGAAQALADGIVALLEEEK